MRKLGKPDREFIPKTPIEDAICATLKEHTKADISSFYTREDYSRVFFDEFENSIDPVFDFIVDTSVKYKDWYCDGLTFGVNVVNGKISFEELSSWIK